jgi:hypothetical protein
MALAQAYPGPAPPPIAVTPPPEPRKGALAFPARSA